MYNLSGLYYVMKSNGVIFGLVGIVFFICSHFWNPQKKNMKDLKIGIIVVLCFLCFTGYYAYAIADLKISMHEGVFIEERRENPFLFRKEYCFSNEDGLKPVFCLDYFSKKEVYPEEFEKGIRYRIYYEKRTNIIVRVDKVE